MISEEEKWNSDDYEVIECIECCEDVPVEKGTWALEHEMCETCYCAYNGG